MSAEACKTQELEFEPEQEEEDNTPVTSRTIIADKVDAQIDSLYRKWKRGKLVLQPEFQRHFVWDNVKASRLIESALLDIPLPIVYITEDVDDKEYVIDGQQRLTSFFSYIDGKFPDGRDFRLSGLKVLKELNNQHYKDIEEINQDKINDFSLRVVTFKKTSDPKLRFEIFKRLNTGAVALNDQELRNCVYRGKYNSLLKELATDSDFRYLLGLTCEEKRMKDVELVLRFASFYHATYLKYNAPIRRFLDNDMETYKNISDKDEADLRTAFKNTIIIIRSLLDKHAFKRFYRGTDIKNKNGRWEEKKFNASLYDILMYTFAKADKNKVYQNLDSIREALIYLMTTDQEFIDSIELSTSSVQAVTKRFDKWRHTVEGIIGIAQKEPRCFTNQLKKELFETNKTCAICGQEIKDIDDSAVDHNKQYWTGGQTIPENARLAHRYCNWARPRNDVVSSRASMTVANADNSDTEEEPYETPKKKVTWEEKLATKDEHVKNLLKASMERMSTEFNDAVFKTTNSLQYSKGEISPSNRFVVFMLREHGIKMRVRVNPSTVADPQKWVGGRSYKWFFYDGNGEEKEFMVTSEDQLDYAMSLVRQSYQLIK